MKKILFLLFFTVISYGQTLQNPTYGIVTEKNNASNSTPTYLVTQEVDGVHKKTPAALFAKTDSLAIKVPYTGATGNVDLGEHGVSGGYLKLDTTPTSIPITLGTISWDATYRTASLIDGIGNTNLQIGQEQRILVHNQTGSTITDGQVVYVTGSTGELPSIALANASSELTSARTIGVATETIANGQNGFIVTSGVIHDLNTNAFNEGDLLWLGTTSGTYTNVAPTSPNHLVLIGYVIKKAGGNGSILVKVQNTQELSECADVLFATLTNNDVIGYESSTGLFKNKTIPTLLGYTPANDSNVVHITGTETITGSKTFTQDTVIGETGTNAHYLALKGQNYAILSLTNSTSNWNVANENASLKISNSSAAGILSIGSDAGANAMTIGNGATTIFAYNNTGRVGVGYHQYEVPNKFSVRGNASFNEGNVMVGTTTDNGTDKLQVNGSQTSTGQIKSTLATGTSPLNVTSTTVNTNLNADLLDGQHGSYYQTALTNPITGTGTTNYLPKFTGTSTLGDSLIYDNGTSVGISYPISVPSIYKLGIGGSLSVVGDIFLRSAGSSFSGYSSDGLSQTGVLSFNQYTGTLLTSSNTNPIKFLVNGNELMRLFSSQNVAIGTTTDNGIDKLQINGSGYFSGNLKADRIYFDNGTGSYQRFSQAIGKWGVVDESGSNYILAENTGKLHLIDDSRSAEAIFDTSTITSSFTRTYNLPDASGTIALEETVKPYKVYTALLTQSGTSAPTATVLENKLGGTVTWSYVSTGQYRATLTGAFTSAKTVCFTTRQYSGTNAMHTFYASRNNNDSVDVLVLNASGGVDSILSGASIEIRVYN